MSKQAIKILILEDNDFDFDLIKRQLNHLELSHELSRAVSEEEFKRMLEEVRPDLILSDFSIPSYSGMEALRFAKSSFHYIPFIFVSGTIGEELAVESLKEGAVDYVIKGNLKKLVPSVKRALRETKEKIKRRNAEEKLKVKVKELKSLVYRISHDFKGPLCTIKGATNLYWAMKNHNPEDQDACVTIIEKVVGKMDNILLNLSSFQHLYNEEILISRIDIHELWEKLKSFLGDEEGFEQVKLDLEIGKEAVCLTEKNFLFYILYNLIHNSIAFSDKTKAEIFVSCKIRCFASGMEIVVEDNGIGMPESIQGNVCDMFYRGNAASQGAGLGLYIIKNGLDLLKGTFNINSKEGEGTKVTVRIPNPDEAGLKYSLAHD